MITLIIIAITAGVSILTMQDNDLKNRYMFNAYAISKHREWWRFFTHGLLHANFPHLFFNMFSLYFFGDIVEKTFRLAIFGNVNGIIFYLFLYISALVVSSIFTFFKQKDNMYYNALGASGAVSAIIFTSILLYPTATIYFWGIPIISCLYGIIYLGASWYMARNNVGNIGHDAHFFGAVYGFILPLVFKPELWQNFIGQLRETLMYTH